MLVRLRNAGDPMPAAAVCLSPWVDLEATGESMMTKAAVDPVVQREGLLTNAKLYFGDGGRKASFLPLLQTDLRVRPESL
jgi:hypothetical protein